jgi:AcrR family transcriptional regulator
VKAADCAMPDAASAGKYTRILDAAQALFWRYGVRRTSIDDVAQEAGVAKGTVYLYFDSKETLFFEVAERLCAEVWGLMNAAEASDGPFVHRLTLLLDAKIGHIKRLLMGSPHAAELMDESRVTLAQPAFDALGKGFHEALDTMIAAAEAAGTLELGAAGITVADFAEAAIAAAQGAIHTGPLDRNSYMVRLERHIALLVAGAAPR